MNSIDCLEIVCVEIAVWKAAAARGDLLVVHLVVEGVDGVLGHGVAQLVLDAVLLLGNSMRVSEWHEFKHLSAGR